MADKSKALVEASNGGSEIIERLVPLPGAKPARAASRRPSSPCHATSERHAKALVGKALVEIADCESKRAGWQGCYGDVLRGLAGAE